MTPPLLEVGDLRLRFGNGARTRVAVNGVGFSMARERLGIVGGSGSGKSLTGRAILGLLPPGATMSAARLTFDGQDLLQAAPQERRALRGRRMALVPQDAKFSLNPMMSIGAQIVETCRAHHPPGRRAAKEKALALLEAMRLSEPQRVFDLYPHEISGGMAQRAMIAMMLAPDPALLIADEPTSALDASVQADIMAVLDEQVSQRGMGVLFISHDLDLVADFCDRVLVMAEGRVVEDCAAGALGRAAHPVTRALLAARLTPIPA
jgi:peptide/nickel transport system ATP-binding protein